jgi:hypothetical protein
MFQNIRHVLIIPQIPEAAALFRSPESSRVRLARPKAPLCGNGGSPCLVRVKSPLISAEKYFQPRRCRKAPRLCFVLVEFLEERCPLPLGSIGIIRLAGESPQNPDDKRLRGQNPGNKGLTPCAVLRRCTGSALTMMGRFCAGHKVRCHKGVVENYEGWMTYAAAWALAFLSFTSASECA